MASSKDFCAAPGNDHALINPKIEVRDNLGLLAVATLANDPRFASMTSQEKVTKLYEVVVDLHNVYEYCREHGKLEP